MRPETPRTVSPHALDRRSALRLGAIGVSSSFAGCIESLVGQRSMEPPPFGPLETDWPMVGHDRRNTGHSQAATGPTGEPTVEWDVQPSRGTTPRFAVDDGLLVVVGDNSVVAYDLDNGARRWSDDVDGPVPVAIDTEACYVPTGSSRLRAHDRADGSVRWTVDAAGTVQAPVVSNGTMYVGDDAGFVRAIDTTDGAERWSVSVGDGVNGPIATDGSAVVATARESIAVLETDGRTRWSEPLPCCSAPAPVLADGIVYTLRHALRAWDVATGDQLWTFDPPWSDNAGPTLDGSRLYVGRLGLEAIDRDTGDRRWTTGGDIRSVPSRAVCGAETVYVPNRDRQFSVAALDPSDGTLRWSKQVDGHPIGYLGVVGDRLLAATGGGSLHSLV